MAVLAPNKKSSGLWRISPKSVRKSPVTTNMKNAWFMIFWAFLASSFPLAMEHRGAPPTPNRLEKAVTMVITGKHSPSPARARVPSPGIFPM